MTDEKDELKENFKELLNEVSKIGEIVDEIDAEDAEGNDNTETSDTQKRKDPVTDENLQDYVYESAANLIDSSLFTLDKIKKSITSVMDHKELIAIADLIKATTNSIDVLNKVAMENKKLQNAKEIKEMDIEAKKEISQNKTKNTTNILVASREEILSNIVDKTLAPTKIIDVKE